MRFTVLQAILFPDPDICGEKAMYFHESGDTLSFDTYFNSFSIGKWRKYTLLTDLALVLHLRRGADGLALTGVCISSAGSRENVPVNQEVTGTDDSCKIVVSFPRLPADGILSVSIQGLDEEDVISGFWGTSAPPVNPVKLALGICTFRREEFLERNLGRLQSYLKDNPDSPLRGHLEAFISDNGRTLDLSRWNTDTIHMFPNKNVGGSGGFTRTMIESMLRNQDGGFTHIVLTDDDIVLSPHVLERTCRFLQYQKPEYQDCMIGGALIDLDQRWRQMEHGANGQGVHQNLFKRYADLRDAAAVAANETEDDVNYCAWIYACIPRGIVRADNLPMPLFLHDDDIEYGIRNTGTVHMGMKDAVADGPADESDTGQSSSAGSCRILFLNGICAWHPNTITKAAGWTMYYDVRNVLIGINSTSCAASWSEFREYASYVLYTRLFHYEYDSAERVVMGIRDYLEGPEAFLALDGEANHQRVMYREKTVLPEKALNGNAREEIARQLDQNELSMNKVLEYLKEAGCLLLPASHKVKVVRDKGVWEPFTAECVYAYDEAKETGVLRTRDRKRMLRIMKDFNQAMRELHRNYDGLQEEWNRSKPEMTSLAFWEKYLGIAEQGD